MNRLEPCAYCKSGYDHSSLGNCPQCGAPTEDILSHGMLLLKGITLEEWQNLFKNGFVTTSEVRAGLGIERIPIETTRSPFTMWR